MKDLLVPELGTYHDPVNAGLAHLDQHRIVGRIWERDHTVWKADPTEISNRLGWLTVADEMDARVSSLREFAETIKKAGFKDVVLLGMGGSSLGPEVLRATFGASKGFPRLWVLDSVVPGAVRDVAKAVRPPTTLFILASKSGGTIEVMSLFAHFSTFVGGRGTPNGGQFLAITDPGTSLVKLAHDRHFRTTFLNPSNIGGRYSVLSYFGLVPAALMGLDVQTLLHRAQEMARLCRHSRRSGENPGAYLGTVMGVLAKAGRDKVTLLASPKIASFGLWVEQLLAESTGKEGRGLIPVADEPLVPIDRYGPDRLFVYLRLNGDANGVLDRQAAALSRAGHPVVRLTLQDRYDLGAQFFCWEFATAVAGYHLGIHPFDQPNVQESKANTSRILDEARFGGTLPDAGRNGKLQEVLSAAEPGRYVALLAYATPSPRIESGLKALRKALTTRSRVTTTAGYGPRYLHSTGQLHKGGPNSGLFVVLLEDMHPDLPIPGATYSFGTLATAQAIGDLQSLETHGRRVVRVDLGRQPGMKLDALLAKLAPAPTRPRRTTPAAKSKSKGRTPRPARAKPPAKSRSR